jgi:tRNA(Ile)-lysidine synthase
VAHHLDDFLETAIMQYEKCSKTLFFGIKKNSNYKSLKILRPFINCRKSELVDYCNNNNISFALDSTNKDISYKRNMIRKRIEKFSKQKFLKEVKKFHSLNKLNEKIRNKSETLYRL